MAKINPEQLTAALKSHLHPVYWVAGDEPLLVQETCDQIRQNLRKQGFSEREVHHSNTSFQWPQLLQSANSFSLFGDKKLLEVRLHSLKVGDAGSKVIKEFCDLNSEDTALLLISEKLDRPTQNTKWFKEAETRGLVVTVWPIKEQQLPRWIDARLKQAGLRADSQAIEILANKVEGNLLAAIQEIEKLKLLSPEGVIDAQLMASAVMDSARFDVFGLVDKTLAGKARAAAASLNGLRGEGTDAIVVLWALAREIRTLTALKLADQKGQTVESQARYYGVFPQRVALVKHALARLSVKDLHLLLKRCAVVDRAVKGMEKRDPWDELLAIVLSLAGQNTGLPAFV